MRRTGMALLVSLTLLSCVGPYWQELGFPENPIESVGVEVVDWSRVLLVQSEAFLHARFSHPEWPEYVYTDIRIQDTNSGGDADLIGLYQPSGSNPVLLMEYPFFDGLTGTYEMEYYASDTGATTRDTYRHEFPVTPYSGEGPELVPETNWEIGDRRMAPIVEWEMGVDDAKDLYIRPTTSINEITSVSIFVYADTTTALTSEPLKISWDVSGTVSANALEEDKWTKLVVGNDLVAPDGSNPTTTVSVADMRTDWDALVLANRETDATNGSFLYSHATTVVGMNTTVNPAHVLPSVIRRGLGLSQSGSIPHFMRR